MAASLNMEVTPKPQKFDAVKNSRFAHVVNFGGARCVHLQNEIYFEMKF